MNKYICNFANASNASRRCQVKDVLISRVSLKKTVTSLANTGICHFFGPRIFLAMAIQSDNGIIWWSFTNIQGQNMCQNYSNKSIPYNMNEISYNALTTSNCPKAIYMETWGSVWFWYWKYIELAQTLLYIL